jgi:hypothetical protein
LDRRLSADRSPRILAEFYSRASLGLFFNDIRDDWSNDNRRLIIADKYGAGKLIYFSSIIPAISACCNKRLSIRSVFFFFFFFFFFFITLYRIESQL